MSSARNIARYFANKIRHLPRLRTVHDRGAPTAHRRALRVGLTVRGRERRPWLCRRWLDSRLGPGLLAKRGLDRVRPALTALLVLATSCASRWRGIRARRSRCRVLSWVRPTPLSAWT